MSKPIEQYIGDSIGLNELQKSQKQANITEARLHVLGTYKTLEASLQEATATLKRLYGTIKDCQALGAIEYVCLKDDLKRVSDPKRRQAIADLIAEMNGTVRNMEKVRDPNYILQLAKLRIDSGNIDFKKDDVVTSLNKQIKNLATAKNSKDASAARREYYQARIDLLTEARELYREEIKRLRAPENVPNEK